ncbi:hypothetical protein M9C83_08085 [SAR86 cluster bacterium]|nr:hypothetical protein M9C83_08085 [SAR86 cluster bacterium]
MKVHLLPASNPDSRKHYIDTILNHSVNCKTEEIKKYVNNQISESLVDKSYALWGVTNGGKDGLLNKNKWLKMEPNDIGLFYKDRKFYSFCLVHEKFHSKDFALKLWGEKFNKKLGINETWENMFIIKDYKDLNISIDTYNKLFGYSEENLLQGYRCLDEFDSESLLDAFNLIDINKTNVELKDIPIQKETSSTLIEHNDGEVSVSSTTRSKREVIIEQKERELVKRYKKHLIKNNIGELEKNKIKINASDESVTLETDGWVHETKTLIEAKASSTRSDIRMAIGQLHDYKRHHIPKPEKLAILLPSQPREDLVDLIYSQNIEIIYEKDKNFYHMTRNG